MDLVKLHQLSAAHLVKLFWCVKVFPYKNIKKFTKGWQTEEVYDAVGRKVFTEGTAK